MKDRKEIKPSDLSNFVFGKVQPQARDLEEAVLGGCLLEKSAMAIVTEILQPASFYVEEHKHLFQAMVNLQSRSQPIDLLTVTEECRKIGELENIGGAFYISELSNRVASAANIEYHSRIVQQKFIQRELIRISSETIKSSYEDTVDVLQLLDEMDTSITKLQGNIVPQPKTEIHYHLRSAYDWMNESKKGGGMAGVPTMIETFDHASGGLVNGELITIAARPAMGKTAFMMTCARNQVLQRKLPIAVFSLEMVGRELIVRMSSSMAGVNGERIRRGLIGDDEHKKLREAMIELAESKLHIDDRSNISAKQIRQAAAKMKAKYDIAAVYIDYVQILSPNPNDNVKGVTRDTQVSGMTRELKNMAKELNIPVIQLAQLNRSVEQRGGDMKPILSDLRESGAIEQDSDQVIFLYRPEYYGWDSDEDGNSYQGLCQAICAKNRNGKLFTANMLFEDTFSNFKKWVAPPVKIISEDEKKSNSKGNGKNRRRKSKTVSAFTKNFSESNKDDSVTDPPPPEEDPF